MGSTAIEIGKYYLPSKAIPDIRPGDTVRVHERIREAGKDRIQVFSGIVIARKHGSEPGATITVRKVTQGVGVEKIYPLYSPLIDKIEIVKRAKVRRAKLYYLRYVSPTKARKKLRQFTEAIKTEETPTPISSENSENTAE